MGNKAIEREPLGVSVVCISDTHGIHRQLKIPNADIFIHAGDFTRFGSKDDVLDFNAWLGTLPHKHKLVVNGNHEYNSSWKAETASLLSNAKFLKNEAYECVIDRKVEEKVTDEKDLPLDDPSASPSPASDPPPVKPEGKIVRVFGKDFNWNMKTPNPYDDLIPSNTDILITHNPPKGYLDGGHGCPTTAALAAKLQPRLLVCGHVHVAQGQTQGAGPCAGTLFVNAANVRGDHNAKDATYHLGEGPIVVTI